MTGGATYVISLVEFLIGTLITAINAVACLISMPKSAQTSNLWKKPDIGRRYLIINIWVSNMFLGLIVAVGHVIESDVLYRVSKVENTDGIASVVDCLAVNASLLVIVSNFLVGLHRPQRCLGRTKSIHVVAAIWTMTAALNFIKAIVSSLYNYNESACFPCLSNFEVVLLSLLTLCTVVIFVIGAYKVYTKKKKSTLEDLKEHKSVQDDYYATITTGFILTTFVVCQFFYLFLQTAWIWNKNLISNDTGAVLIVIFYLHSLINPVFYMIREREIRNEIKKFFWCCFSSSTTIENHNETHQEQQDPLFRRSATGDRGTTIENPGHVFNVNVVNDHAPDEPRHHAQI